MWTSTASCHNLLRLYRQRPCFDSRRTSRPPGHLSSSWLWPLRPAAIREPLLGGQGPRSRAGVRLRRTQRLLEARAAAQALSLAIESLGRFGMANSVQETVQKGAPFHGVSLAKGLKDIRGGPPNTPQGSKSHPQAIRTRISPSHRTFSSSRTPSAASPFLNARSPRARHCKTSSRRSPKVVSSSVSKGSSSSSWRLFSAFEQEENGEHLVRIHEEHGKTHF